MAQGSLHFLSNLKLFYSSLQIFPLFSVSPDLKAEGRNQHDSNVVIETQVQVWHHSAVLLCVLLRIFPLIAKEKHA